MSINKWKQLAEKKAALEAQNAKILNTFKKHEIEKQFGEQASERFFKPVTRRLEPIPEEEKKKEEGPDYGMDEFDRLNPFDADFKPDEETPPSLDEDDEGDDEDDEEPTMEEKKSRKEWETPKPPPELPSESNDLQNINRMLTTSKGKQNYKVTKGKYKGLTRKELFEEGLKIYDRRGESPPEKYNEFFNTQADQTEEEESFEDAQEGSGFSGVDALIHQLYLSMESMKAGNTSQKLRTQIKEITKELVSEGVLTKNQAQKITSKI